MLASAPRAVVTGAAGGLGRSLAVKLGARGGHVVCSDVDEAGLAETVKLVVGAGGRALSARCDVAVASEVEALRDTAERELGGVDLVVNNAGVAVGGLVGDVPIEDWRWIVDINLMGVVHGCHYFLPAMRQRRSGWLLNVASIAGHVYAPNMGPYNATKAAVVALTETLAVELEGSGVGATALCPYFFRTNIARSSRTHTKGVTTEGVERLMDKSKLTADDVAELALEACDAGKVQCFPHLESKVLQAVKRASPALLRKLAGTMAKLAK
jgi:NAD(P)-dependent dehydrogenase (short-subunit alcohol dehydrogenase family)